MSIPSQLEIETFCNLKNAKDILVKTDYIYSITAILTIKLHVSDSREHGGI